LRSKAQIRLLFYISWLSLNFFQSANTQLIGDEAYYWMYSRQLAWGYFDHPPMIALFIQIGFAIFKGELGLRLLSILGITTMIYILERISKPEKIGLFYMLISSVAILHFISFLAIPDVPLLFFSTLFFLLYKSFLKRPGTCNSLLLGLSTGLMLLSKYHAILIIVFALLPNLQLLRKKHFYIVFFTAMLVFFPHIYWQYTMDFPSVRYHLMDRNQEAYSIRFTLEYLLSQLFLLGPITGLLILVAAIKSKTKTSFDKTLHWVYWGGLLFFLIMSLKGKVEAHWTLFSILPGILILQPYIERQHRMERIFKIAFIPTIILILFMRMMFIYEMDIKLGELTEQFHDKEKVVRRIAAQAKDHPVAFMNSYQWASWYEFYAGKPAFSLNNIMGRRNQFDIWHSMEKYRGDTVLLIPNYHVDGLNQLPALDNKVQFLEIANFQSYPYVQIESLDLPDEIKAESSFNLKVRIESGKMDTLEFDYNPEYPSFLCCQWFQHGKLIKEQTLIELKKQKSGDVLKVDVKSPIKQGSYQFIFSIRNGWLPPTINSSRNKIRVK
jgi:hypothetical protein